ncbi:hypothetical protein FSARC_10704 [Fusarium sarcochroum]|uniref:Uncharacterized protein n=1 Tax=Fusarium sarcochroum TaxID=1208366 RepID=A0A8H4TKN6_9HYPO|nr:hypothetical protein FSARC_10704 [Fusarium sarcochroum]
MDPTSGLAIGRITFTTRDNSSNIGIDNRDVQLGNLRDLQDPSVQDNDAWQRVGIMVIRLRHFASVGFATGDRVLSHVDRVSQAIREELSLDRRPTCLEATILYGNRNPLSMMMDVTQLNAITVTVEQDIPSSRARMALTKATAERQLANWYGDQPYQCMVAAHAGWEILEISHPLTAAMRNCPMVVCHPGTLDARRDCIREVSVSPWAPGETSWIRHHPEQSWMQLCAQQPSELLMRRVASSNEGSDPVVPLVSPNVSGDPAAQPEDRIMMRFVIWHRQADEITDPPAGK